MKNPKQLLLCVLLLSSLWMITVELAYASPCITVLPDSAFVGQGRTIMLSVKAEDLPAQGVEKLELVAENVPDGVKIRFNPQCVYWPQPVRIESTMYVYAGVDATPGPYTITVKAIWYNDWYPLVPPWSATTSFDLEVKAASTDAWTENPSLQDPFPVMNKWKPACYRFMLGLDYSPRENGDWIHFANWNASGRVDMKATDIVSADFEYLFTGEASEFYQTPSTPLSLDPRLSLTFKAAVENYGQTVISVPWVPVDFTGVKLDAWAKSIVDGRELYVEMYFLKGGWNNFWNVYYPNNGYELSRTLGENIDDYMVDITNPSFSGKVFVETTGPTTYFTVDLTYFFKRACELHGKNLANYRLYTVGTCMEAWAADGIAVSWASFTHLEVKKSNLADVNCDNKVNSADFNIVLGAISTELGDADYVPMADINQDGSINQTDLNLVDQFWDRKQLTVGVYNSPPEGVSIWINGTLYKAWVGAPVSVSLKVGPYTVRAQSSFIAEAWEPGMYFFYKFSRWSDGPTANPRTVDLVSDKSFYAIYSRSTFGIW